MDQFILNIVLLLFTFYLIARVVDVFFVESLEIVSKRLKLSSDVAGATFMAVGSSAPELFVSFLALWRISEQQAIGAGTIVGSAIFNVLVIIGISALYKRAVLTWQPVIRDMLFYVVVIILLFFTFSDGAITLIEAIYFVAFYVAYLFSFGIWKKWFPYQTKGDIAQKMIEEDEIEQQKIRSDRWTIKNVADKILCFAFVDLSKYPKLYMVNFLVAVLMLGGLSYIMVESAVGMSQYLGIPEVIISLTILAIGTSIPDLLSSINVAKKGRGDMAIANAVGSNIFDIALGLGLPWLIIILWKGESVPVLTENLDSSIILLFATVVALLFLLVAKRWEIGRYAGILLVGMYIFYILTQIGIIDFELCLNVLGHWCFAL